MPDNPVHVDNAKLIPHIYENNKAKFHSQNLNFPSFCKIYGSFYEQFACLHSIMIDVRAAPLPQKEQQQRIYFEEDCVVFGLLNAKQTG
jgi:hypothetical protein